jgi:hypothetical protein
MPPFPIADTGTLIRTYSGVLDDAMIRYGKGKEFLSPEYFNKMILKNVIFGSGMFLNDGYLVNHELARKYLVDHDSLLSHMISTGFIRILSREPDADKLATMPEKMAKNGNASFQTLVDSKEWKESIGPAYRQMAIGVFHSGTVRAWPRYDMSEGFCELMSRTLQSAPQDIGLELTNESDLRRIADAFWERNPKKGNARDALEKAAIQVNRPYEKEYDLRMAEIMEIANQAYHYNFGLTLNAEEGKATVAADTTKGMAFDELLQLRKVERAQIDQVPLISLPGNIPMEYGELFLPFIRAEHPLSEAKRQYMFNLGRLISENAHDIPNLARDAREATEAYKRRIEEHFQPILGKVAIDTMFSESVSIGLSKNFDHPAATAASTAQIAIEMQRKNVRDARRFLIEQFEIVDETKTVDDETEKYNALKGNARSVVRIGDIRSQLSSIAFDEQEAKKFVAGLHKFEVV